MKQIIAELLSNGTRSFKVPVLTYETVEEAEKDGGVGSVLAECNANLLARGAYADAREIIVEVVQNLTKIPFNTVEVEKEVDGKKVKTKVRDPKETDLKYVNRALAGAPDDTFAKAQAIVTDICLGKKDYNDKGELVAVPTAEQKPLAVDIKQKVRVSRVTKLAEKWKLAAKQFLAAPARLANFNKALDKAKLGAFTPTGNAAEDETALGWKCKAWADSRDVFAQI